MKNIIIFFCFTLLILFSCKKEKNDKDYRDSKVGVYSCTSMRKFVENNVVYFEYDSLKVTLTKSSSKDSIIQISVFEEDLILENDSFSNVTNNWPRIFGFFLPPDSVKFEYIPGLGPEHIWYEGKKEE